MKLKCLGWSALTVAVAVAATTSIPAARPTAAFLSGVCIDSQTGRELPCEIVISVPSKRVADPGLAFVGI